MHSNAVLWLSCMLLCILAVSGDVYFEKKGYLEYDATSERIISVKDSINVTFKTVEATGLLMHASSVGGDASDYITLELMGGKLRYAARLGGFGGKYDDHEVYLGDDLEDGLPHTVQVKRIGKEVTIRLDPGTSDSVVKQAKSEYKNLDIDRYIFTGGATAITSRQGVKSETNFMGCIMLASFEYTDEQRKVKSINLLKEYDQRVLVKDECPSGAYEPFTFIGSGAKFVADTGSTDKMVGSFKFRTYHKEGNLVKQKKFTISYTITSVQLKIDSQQPTSVVLSEKINRGNWMTVDFQVSSGKVELKVNGGQPSDSSGISPSGFFGTSTTFGEGFIGCMRDITINSKKHIPSESIPESERPNVQMKKCNINDFCSPNPCQNGGKCSQDGRDFNCECSPPEKYTGVICQFSTYPQNCEEIKKKDKNAVSKNYTIDADGSGPLKPFIAFCNMTTDLPAQTEVFSTDQNIEVVKFPAAEGEGKLSYVRTITYVPSIDAAKVLARNSENCRQFIEYGCKKSPLLNDGDYYGRWVSADGVYKSYWGGADPSSKACGCYPNCLDSKKCNCDAMRNSWESDKGFLTETNALPVSQVQFGGVNKEKGNEGNFTVGNLICYGEVSNTATFVNEDGMLKIKPWTPPSHGDLSFFFKTPYARGVLISNGDISSGDLNKDYVQLQITNKTTMLLTFNIGNGAQAIYTSVKKRELNDREWHKVSIYRNQKEFSLKVDDIENKLKLDLSKKKDLDVEGPMYLGSDAKVLNGFVGCMRGLAVNGQVKDLETAANDADSGSYVNSGCGAACDKSQNQCQLGSTCTDDYNVYRCNCTMTPFYGYFCHKDHGAQFDSKESQMTYTFAKQESVPGVSVVVGFKTNKCQGDIVKITSKTPGQYLALQFDNGALMLTFKTSDGDVQIDLPGSFCDNERHTFALNQMNRRIEYKVDDGGWKRAEKPRLDKPFSFMYQVMVGSTGEKGFGGCITGAKVTQRFFEKKNVPIEPIEAYLYYESATEEIKAQKKSISVSGINTLSREKCGDEPKNLPPIPTPRIPAPVSAGPRTTAAPTEDGDEGNNTAIIVIVVLILILVIVAVLVAIYWYWSRHKGVYHTHEDDENLKGTDPYIDLVPTNKGEETQKKKEWYI